MLAVFALGSREFFHVGMVNDVEVLLDVEADFLLPNLEPIVKGE